MPDSFEALLEKHEIKKVQRILLALQRRADRSMYSKETPGDEIPRDSSDDQLSKLFPGMQIGNSEINNIVLPELHINMVGICRALLVGYDHQPSPETQQASPPKVG